MGNLSSEFGDNLAVNLHKTLRDKLVSLATRANSGISHELVQANLLIGIGYRHFILDALGTRHEALARALESLLAIALLTVVIIRSRSALLTIVVITALLIVVAVTALLTVVAVTSLLTVVVVAALLTVVVLAALLTVVVIAALLTVFVVAALLTVIVVAALTVIIVAIISALLTVVVVTALLAIACSRGAFS